MADAHKLGTRIKQLRVRHGLSLDKLAKKAGFSKGYLWQIETDTMLKPSARKLQDLARALNTTLEFLLGENDTPESAEDKAFYRRYMALPVEKKELVRNIARLIIADSESRETDNG